MNDAPVPDAAKKEEERQESSVLDAVDPVGAAFDVAAYSATPACKVPLDPNFAAVVVPSDPSAIAGAAAEGAASVLSDGVSGIGDAISGLFDVV